MQHPATDMDDRRAIDPMQDPQVRGIVRKLAFISDRPSERDSDVAPLFPGFKFDVRLVAGITPIERGQLLDFFIDRPCNKERPEGGSSLYAALEAAGWVQMREVV